MFYDAHFIIDVTNWSQGIWLDGTMQIMGRENILLSDRLVPTYLPEFLDDRRSASEGLASIRTPRMRRGVGSVSVSGRFLTAGSSESTAIPEKERRRE
jgi:hypothetical protein